MIEECHSWIFQLCNMSPIGLQSYLLRRCFGWVWRVQMPSEQIRLGVVSNQPGPGPTCWPGRSCASWPGLRPKRFPPFRLGWTSSYAARPSPDDLRVTHRRPPARTRAPWAGDMERCQAIHTSQGEHPRKEHPGFHGSFIEVIPRI